MTNFDDEEFMPENDIDHITSQKATVISDRKSSQIQDALFRRSGGGF